MNFKIIYTNDVFSVSVSHEKCDGTHNIHLKMQDGTEVELFGISRRVIKDVEYNLTHPDLSIKFDSRFLNRTEEQWLSQNGIKGDKQ